MIHLHRALGPPNCQGTLPDEVQLHPSCLQRSRTLQTAARGAGRHHFLCLILSQEDCVGCMFADGQQPGQAWVVVSDDLGPLDVIGRPEVSSSMVI